jgi:transcriptional antiterminator RfaH
MGDTIMAGERWYVARIRTEVDRCAINNLEYQQFEVYWPRYHERRIVRGHKIDTSYPVFRGYLFLFFNIAEDKWRAINYTLGVIHLLPLHLEIPMALPIGFIEGLKTSVNLMEIKKTVANFTKHQLVRLVAGPFAAHQARIVDCEKKSARVIISSFAGRETLVTVDTEHLEAIRSSSSESPSI